jgi:hypothetical protein
LTVIFKQGQGCTNSRRKMVVVIRIRYGGALYFVLSIKSASLQLSTSRWSVASNFLKNCTSSVYDTIKIFLPSIHEEHRNRISTVITQCFLLEFIIPPTHVQIHTQLRIRKYVLAIVKPSILRFKFVFFHTNN